MTPVGVFFCWQGGAERDFVNSTDLRRIIFYKESDVPVQTDYSPWGEIQALETLYPGIHLITTPGHGGIMAEWPAYLELSGAARKCGFRENGCLWFEEDRMIAFNMLQAKKVS